MFRIWLVLAAGIALGAALASTWRHWPVRPGWFGATALIGAALAGRAYWARPRASTWNDPSPSEREAWHGLVGASTVGGHLACALLQGVDLHIGRGNTLAVDNWTLIAGALVAYYVVRAEPGSDERDRAIAARGLAAGYYTLLALLAVLLFTLGFAPPAARAGLSHWVVANVLIVTMVASHVAQQVALLLGYWRDAHPRRV